MPLSFNQTVELLGLSHYEALTLYAVGLFPNGERLGESCHLVFSRAAIDAYLFELRRLGELHENVEFALGRHLNI